MIRCYPRSFVTRCCVLSVILLLTAHCALLTVRAQSATATISGTVEDQNGAVIPGVNITIQNTGTSFERQATSSDAGSFTIPLLPPGTYTLTARRDGFTPVEIRNVVLNVGDQKSLQIELKVGPVGATVDVKSDAPLINESPAVGTVVDRQFVGNLPLNGRSFQSLIALTPGVILTKTSYLESGQFSVNGQRADANYFTVDGVSANFGVNAFAGLQQSGGGSLPALTAFGGTNNLVSVDALQEFKIQTSTYAPEFGRTPGAQVSIITRSGTNDLHGTLFEYLRNDVLDANNWFANSRGLKRPALRQNDFGGVFGGPVIKNRTFFFFSYEGLRLRQPQTKITAVPSMAVRQNAPQQIQPFLNAFPIPNGRDLGNGLVEFNGSYSDPSTLNATSIRVDHAVSTKLTLFGRYNYAPSETEQRGASGASLNTVRQFLSNTQTLTASANWAISSHINNDLRTNYSRASGATPFIMDNFGGGVPPPDSLLFPSSLSRENSLYIFFLVTGVSSFNLGKGDSNIQRQLNLVNNLSLTTSAHQFKFGIDYRRLSPTFTSAKYQQVPLFLGVANALNGRAPLVFITNKRGERFSLFTNLSVFAQDTWHATRRMTLTYGLRWEYNPPPSERKGNDPFAVTGLDNPSTLALAPKGTPLWKATHNNFAPRIGMAYQLSQRQGKETLLRGGFGIFYDLGSGQAGNALSDGFPFFTNVILLNVPFPLTPAQAAPPPFNFNPPFGTIYAFDPNLKLPYTIQWNVAVEQSLGSNQSVSASYVGALGRRLLREGRLQNPNPNFTLVLATSNSATSDYHALQLRYNRRLSRGLQAFASYTWSKSLDTASDDSSGNNLPLNLINIRQERGPSNFDVRHSFTAAVTYNIPDPTIRSVGAALLRNWSVDTIVVARSATPVNVVTGTDPFGVGSLGSLSVSRPDLILGVPLYIDDPAVAGGRRINRAAFAVPPVGRQGTLGRNALRGFSISQVDVALRREFNLTDRLKLQFRAELFNIFNHPNFADPRGVLTDPFFGQSTLMLGQGLGSGGAGGGFSPLYQVGGPRSTQFAVKLVF
ncbi:MAG TPA: carboxypeptidase regulatory-like domain-containing protein [Pyrinomonadaceae bacterium]|nr:carboxypeptidase regulatory-like domain-containing protein [Pyrinomonadaceae bacterium]